MASFKVSIEGLELFKKQLAGDSTLKMAMPDISIAILELHNKIEQRVKDVFAAPGELSSVMIGSSVKPDAIGNTFLRYSLQYRWKSIPLVQFPINSFPVAVPEQRFTRWIGDNFGMITVNKAVKTEVSVRRGRYVIPRRVKGSRLKGFLLNNNVVSRTKLNTWESFPTKNSRGIRTKLQTLYGPSLSTLAAKVYEVDPQVQKQLTKLDDEIINAFTKWYK